MTKSNEVGFNINSFVKGSSESKNLVVETPTDIVGEIMPATTMKRSKKKNSDNVTEVIPTPVPQTSMSYIQENIPYQAAYNETNQQLDDVIAQLNILNGELIADMQMIRASKTMKNKFSYINNMTENAVGIANAKLTAIREKNNTISKVNDLEIRRIKELKLQASEEDDNTRIANLYNAFINTPIATGGNVLGPSLQEMTMVGQGNQYSYSTIGGVDDTLAWQANLDAASNRMLLDAQGKIETVVVYDESTGARYYEVIDKMTRQPVPNVEKPDNSNIYSLDINIRGMFAKDGDRNVIYPLVVINGGNSTITEY